ncbi:MAG: hypothetical protein WA949_20390 [Phormidesmis sp.]
MPGRFFCPTTGFNKSYLAIAWNSRHSLTESERRGFSQFFYLTISSHVESLLAKIIGARVRSIQSLTVFSPVPGGAATEETLASYREHESLVRESFSGVVSSLRVEVETAPLNKLIMLYKRMFQKSLRDVVGRELYDDLDALASLRNTVAHGRDLYLEFEDERRNPEDFYGPITLDGNPLKKASERLLKSGVLSISVTDIDPLKWYEFIAYFYCDAALLYFHDAVIQIEDSLRSSSDHSFESIQAFVPPLPKLEDTSKGETHSTNDKSQVAKSL